MDSVLKLIKDELDTVNNEISNIEIESNKLGEVLINFVTTSSKRIRSLVTILYVKSLKNSISFESIKTIAAGEIIHNASLLQDDVIDGAKLRRGKTTIGTLFSPKISILAGDMLLTKAIEKLLSTKNEEILKLFLTCTESMCNAEINQYFARGKILDLETYIEICAGKTAKLFQAILESCAIIEEIDISPAKQFALDFGIYFQLKNDLEEFSAKTDKQNQIYTLKDMFGIEKTMILVDNYQKKIQGEINNLPDNQYKKGLENLLYKL